MQGREHRIRDFLAANKINLEIEDSLNNGAAPPYTMTNTGGGGFPAWVKANLQHLLPPALSVGNTE